MECKNSKNVILPAAAGKMTKKRMMYYLGILEVFLVKIKNVKIEAAAGKMTERKNGALPVGGGGVLG